jgi:16S rRNA (adenine1518-N6/adenine1519-N6)-dimethyltransferase
MSDLLKKTREICKLLEIKPARSKGQNFLINEKIYDDLVKAAAIQPHDIVLEIGPGLGFLTAKLAKAAKRVIAVELDDALAAYLQMAVAAQAVENVEIVNVSIMDFDLGAYFKENGGNAVQKYKIVANLPYNITSIFLRTFLSAVNKPESLTLMLQKEVASRIIATAPDNNILALSVAYYGEAKIIREVKAGNFWPEPKVDSAIIKIVPAESAGTNQKDDKLFFRLIRMAFSAKRKMLKNNLAAGLKMKSLETEKILISAGFDPKRRAEDLSLLEFKKLFAALRSFML